MYFTDNSCITCCGIHLSFRFRFTYTLTFTDHSTVLYVSQLHDIAVATGLMTRHQWTSEETIAMQNRYFSTNYVFSSTVSCEKLVQCCINFMCFILMEVAYERNDVKLLFFFFPVQLEHRNRRSNMSNKYRARVALWSMAKQKHIN